MPCVSRAEKGKPSKLDPTIPILSEKEYKEMFDFSQFKGEKIKLDEYHKRENKKMILSIDKQLEIFIKNNPNFTQKDLDKFLQNQITNMAM